MKKPSLLAGLFFIVAVRRQECHFGSAALKRIPKSVQRFSDKNARKNKS
jgi:hypothetical protein